MTTSAAPEPASSPYESGNLSDLLEAEGTIGESRTQFLTPRQLMLLRFKRNKLAVISFWFLALLYLSALFAPVISPYDKTHRFNKHLYLPPREIHIINENGGLQRPFVYAVKIETNKETFTRDFVEDRSQQYPVQFFVKGDPYKLWGLFRMDWHLFGVENAEEVGPIFLLGGDKFGRDILGRALYGGRISLTIGLVGVTISLIIGLLLGGLSGLYGGVVDNLIQRLIEFIRSIPTIPLWMGLAAALPADWPQIRIYFGITIILSLLAWTTLARVVRGKFLSLRNEDFVLAAQSAGANQWYLIWQHLVPSFMSYVLVDITLAIPGMIIGETALSFLGLGLVSPTVSWGVMLKDAQQVVEIAIHPWILWPAMFVVVTV
ncbi:MAG: ABC transporter permease, partial [Caldilineaceae bacterium]|nr:ABC transporter permease [Caldilineaceae bacterium]